MPSFFTAHPSSFRDPSGFIFGQEGQLYRQVNRVFQRDFDKFISSGLYSHLAEKKLIVRHEEIDANLSGQPDHYKTLKPERLPFISYPYEWSFSMLKEAAQLTLQLANIAMQHGMMLKDATPYNVQFRDCRPVFIDSLSFVLYDETKPWIAYRQFCESFLAPLLLAHYLEQPVHGLLLAHPEGIPLRMASAMLPRRTKYSLHTALHIHLHAKAGARATNKEPKAFNRKKLSDIFKSLEILVDRCQPPPVNSAWSEYYEEAGSRDNYIEQKTSIIGNWISGLEISSAADLGANTGMFAQMLAGKNINCIAADADPHCIEALYKLRPSRMDPLVADLSNPSPAIGVNNEERLSLISRLQGTELVMALALIHHLAIGRNIPFPLLAKFFRQVCSGYLIIEFVPKEDEKVKLLLRHREDIFANYDLEHFEKDFGNSFVIRKKEQVGSSGRTLYFMEIK